MPKYRVDVVEKISTSYTIEADNKLDAKILVLEDSELIIGQSDIVFLGIDSVYIEEIVQPDKAIK